jgi:hypothetical protein
MIVYAVVFGIIAGLIWSSKGGRYGGGFAWGFFLGIFGLLYVGFAKPRLPGSLHIGEGAETVRRVRLEGGAVIPAGYRTVVMNQSTIDAEPAVEITGPSGGTHWIPRSDLRGIPDAAWVAPREEKKCPRCAESVKAEAQVCRFCGHEFVTTP